jgi:DNA-binding GntR family transcriptional regulator
MIEPVVKSSTLTEKVLDSIRTAIVSGSWSPGERHSMKEVAAVLDVSRTPVREALLKLADAGLIAFEPNVGFVVLRRTPSQIAEIFHLRLLLEVPAVELTASTNDPRIVSELREEIAQMWAAASVDDAVGFMRHDRRFHDLAVGGAGNTRLVTIVQSLRDATSTLGASTVHRSRSLSDIASEHQPIMDAIENHEPEEAANALRAHLLMTGTLLLRDAAPLSTPDNGGMSPIAQRLWESLQLASLVDATEPASG